MTAGVQNPQVNKVKTSIPTELDSFGKDIGRSLANLLSSWGDEDGASKSLLRRISTKSRKFLKKKKRNFDNEDELDDNFEKEIEVDRLENGILEKSVEQVPLKPPALFSSKSVHEAPNSLSRTLTYRRISRFHDATAKQEITSDTEILWQNAISKKKEEDTRTNLTDPDYATKTPTCHFNTRVRYVSYREARTRSKSLGRGMSAPRNQFQPCAAPEDIGKGIKRLIFG